MIHFIPATVIHQLLNDERATQQKKLPLCFRTNSVVMVAELRNFYDSTMIIDGEFVDEQSYNESLWNFSHNFLQVFSSTLNKYSGDII